MSGLLGVLSLDGRPADRNTLDPILGAMARWGPDGRDTWTEGPIALGCLLHHETPESATSPLPLHHAAAPWVLVATGRIDNRRELLDRLDVPPPRRDTFSDAAVMMGALERWGTDAPRHLLGDWSLALWDREARRLFLARDSFGSASLYWFRDEKTLVFASSLRGLLAHPAVPRELDAAGLASVGGRRKSDGACCYRGVHRLLPAQAMTVTQDHTESWRYWSPLEFREVRLGSDDAYVEAFLEVYGEAVRCRLRHHSRPVGLMLSSGWDSTSVAALASPEIARLRTYTLVPSREVGAAIPQGRLADESGFVDLLARRLGNLDPRFVRTETPVLQAIERLLEAIGQPERNAESHEWNVDVLRAAAGDGTGVLLSGNNGNLSISFTGDFDEALWRALRQFRFGRAWRELRASRRGLADALQRMVSWRAHHPHALKMRLPQPLRAEFLAAQPPASRDEIDDVRRRTRWIPLRHALNQYRSGGPSIPALVAADFGLALRSPAFDRRVVEFCAGIPGEQFLRDGEPRRLLRRAMAGRLPPEILDNPRRGFIAGDLSSRGRAEHVSLEAALARWEAQPLARTVLDLPTLRQKLLVVRSRSDFASTEAMWFLVRGLMVGSFLEQWHEPALNYAGVA